VKILFFGSSEFSIPFLNAVNNSKHEIAGVVTGVQKIRSRGTKPTPNPVKEYADFNNLNCIEIEIFNDFFYNWLSSLNFDYAVVVSFGKIFPQKFFQIVLDKTINLHPSLLPKYRGPSPITAALLNGDKQTGISLIKVEEEVDTGDIYTQIKFPIDLNDNRESLENKIVILGSKVLIGLLDLLEVYKKENLKFPTFPQSKKGISYTRIYKKEDTIINWDEKAEKIFNKVRAFGCSPACITTFKGQLVKILKVRKVFLPREIAINFKSGQVIHAEKDGLFVKCKEKNIKGSIKNTKNIECIFIEKIKPAGKNEMSYVDFINGYKIKQGDFFGI